MSENPGPASAGTHHGDDQSRPPVDTGPGPNEADVNQETSEGQDTSDAG